MDPEFLNTEGEHEHDNTVTSVAISQPGNVDLKSIEAFFIGKLLQERGADIFLMKSVLSVAGSEKKFVYHAVHMTFNSEFSQEWKKGEERVSKLVFIGKKLDDKELRESFKACLA
ncbi:CobW C-terminal domain-containing protein [Pycnococcus provasolii]